MGKTAIHKPFSGDTGTMLKIKSTVLGSGPRKLLVALAIFLLAATSSDAQEKKRPRAVDLLPERTSLYIEIDNVRQTVADFQDSNFGRMLADEKIKPFVESLYGSAMEAYDEVKDQVGEEFSTLWNLPTGEVSFAIITPRRESPAYVLIMDLSEENGTAGALIQKLTDLGVENGATREAVVRHGIETFHVRDGNEGEAHYVLHEGTLLAASREAEFDQILGRMLGVAAPEDEKEGLLRDNRKFTTIMNKCRSISGKPNSITGFVDPITLAKGYTQGDVAANVVFGVLRTLGLDGVNGVGGSIIFNEEDYESVFHGHILLGSPREGIFNMIALKPGLYDPEPFVPATATNYITSHWDFRTFYAELTKIVDLFSSEGTFKAQVDENVNKELGIDLEKDLIENLAGRVSLVTWNNSVKAFNAQSTILSVEVRDVAAGTELIDKIVKKFNEEGPGADNRTEDMLVKAEFDGVTYWKMRADFGQLQRERRQRNEEQGSETPEVQNLSDRGGVRIQVGRQEIDEDQDFPTRFPQPCMAFIDNHFVITESVECLEHMISTSKGKNEQLAKDKKFRGIMQEMERLLDTRLPSMTMYSRPDEALRTFYDVALSEETQNAIAEQSEDNRFFKSLKKAFDENELPPFEDLAHYFPPQGGFVVNEDTGFHFLFFQRRAEVKR
jgi:hypothetical protein